MTRVGSGSGGRADVIVVGAGLAGLTTALELADRGAGVLLLADVRRGEASPAAAGALAPEIDPPAGAAAVLARRARDEYPDYVAGLVARTGIDVPLNREGVLEAAETPEDADRLRGGERPGAEWLDAASLAELEPALAHLAGAWLHPRDGAVNNLVLIRALKHALARSPRVRIVADAAEEISVRLGFARIRTRGGQRLEAQRAVLATGAWAAELAGLPRPLPVEPVRGQMMSVASRALRHVVVAAGGLAVPRADGRTLVGSTFERVGFDAAHSEAGEAAVRAIATRISPALAGAQRLSVWAGLRPMTPDRQPIVGADPQWPALVYACGHSRNGVLLAPITGRAAAALALGQAPGLDLTPYRVERFSLAGAGQLASDQLKPA